MEGSVLPYRGRPAEGVLFVEGQPTVIFDTVCTKDRKSWLSNPENFCLLCEVWEQATHWLVGQFVILPDHLHYFAWGTVDSPTSFEDWVSYWKRQFSVQHRKPKDRWQSLDWDVRMRDLEHYVQKSEYMSYNPVKHGLVERPEDWPYRGEIFRCRWD